MSIWSLTDQQSAFKRYHSDKHFSEFYLQDGGKKSTGIDMEQSYVTVTLCIHAYKHSITRAVVVKSARLLESTRKELTNSVHVQLILVVCVAWRPRNQVSVGN